MPLLSPPEPYVLVLTGFGLLTALVVWLPLALRALPLSLPIVCVALGAALFSVPGVPVDPLPWHHPELAERFSELVVIVALMGAGLKIDRVFRWREWQVTWRLLAITMPLGIAAITLIGWTAGLALPAALLLAASLAPTDPVLAADVQVGPPRTGEEDDVRFGLTSEAGLNDGLAFPFVHLAVSLAAVAAAGGGAWFWEWLSYRVVWEVGAGTLVGWLIGRAFGWLTFHAPVRSKLARTGDGLIALSATAVSYGLTEIIHCYGFLAVFVTALTFRHSHRDHEFHEAMHDVVEQVERLLMMVLLLLFGGAVVSGLLGRVGWVEAGIALAVLLAVRPLTGLVALRGARGIDRGEALTLSFFGIRGVGSVYYLTYGLNHGRFEDGHRLWGIVGLAILLSVLLHGLTVTPVMRLLDREHGRDPDADVADDARPEGASA